MTALRRCGNSEGDRRKEAETLQLCQLSAAADWLQTGCRVMTHRPGLLHLHHTLPQHGNPLPPKAEGGPTWVAGDMDTSPRALSCRFVKKKKKKIELLTQKKFTNSWIG